MQVSTAQVSTAQVSIMQVSITQVSIMQVSTMQVSILSDTGSVKELARAVETVMLTLNWTRLSYTNMNAEDGGKFVYYKLMRFIKTGGMNNV